MQDKKEILDLIYNSIKSEIASKTIGELRYEMGKVTLVPYNNMYDNYTIEEFLILNKIDRLERMKVIPQSIASNLRIIYEQKIQLERILGYFVQQKLFNSSSIDHEKKLEEVERKIDYINIILEKYHLVITDMDSIIDLFVFNENYEQKENAEDLDEVIKKLEMNLK